jgi:cbb3-type cytochrome oxidase maturation protein
MASQMLIIYLFSGLCFCLFVIIWAVRSHQFQDQDRAKWLPLRDLSDEELNRAPAKRITPSVGMIFVVLLSGVGVLVHLAVRLAQLD